MRRRAVDQRGLQGRGLESLTDDTGLSLGVLLTRDLATNLRCLIFTAGKRDPQTIAQRDLGGCQRLRRKVRVIGIDDELSDPCGYIHDKNSPRSVSLRPWNRQNKALGALQLRIRFALFAPLAVDNPMPNLLFGFWFLCVGVLDFEAPSLRVFTPSRAFRFGHSRSFKTLR